MQYFSEVPAENMAVTGFVIRKEYSSCESVLDPLQGRFQDDQLMSIQYPVLHATLFVQESVMRKSAVHGSPLAVDQ